MRSNEGITKTCHAMGIIIEDVDKLVEQVSSLEKLVNGGKGCRETICISELEGFL